MADFERKGEKVNSAIENQGDPLLELTRLFGARPRTPAADIGGSQALASQMTTQQDGISMAGSIMMGGMGMPTLPPVVEPASTPPDFFPSPIQEPVDDAGASFSDMESTVQAGNPPQEAVPAEQTTEAGWRGPVWEDMQLSSLPPSLDEPHTPVANEKMDPNFYEDTVQAQQEEMPWLPIAEDWPQDLASFEPEDVESRNETPVHEGQIIEYDDEQLFHALQDDLIHNIDTPQTGHGGEIEQNGAAFPEFAAQNTHLLPELPPQDLPAIAQSFSGGYFGYGQAVQVDVNTAHHTSSSLRKKTAPSQQQADFVDFARSLPHTPESATREQNIPQTINTPPPPPPVQPPLAQNVPVQSSPIPPIERLASPVAPLDPPPVSCVAQEPVVESPFAHPPLREKPSIKAPEPFPDFSDMDTVQAFSETLHDFDLTIQRERRRRARPASFSQTIEQTQTFDLPPIDYGTASLLPEDDFVDAFSPTNKTASVGEVDPFFIDPSLSPQTSAIPSFSTEQVGVHQQQAIKLPEQEEAPNGIYNWSTTTAPKKTVTPVQKSRKIYALLGFLLLVGLSVGGYLAYDLYTGNQAEPVLIKADSGAIKTRQGEDEPQQLTGQDMAIYNQEQAQTPQRQDELLNASEAPLDIDALAIAPARDSTSEPTLSRDSLANVSQNTASPPTLDSNLIEDMDLVDASILQATSRVAPLHIVPTVTLHRDEEGNISQTPPSQGGEEIFVPAGDYRTQIIKRMNEHTPPHTGDTTAAASGQVASTLPSRSITVPEGLVLEENGAPLVETNLPRISALEETPSLDEQPTLEARTQFSLNPPAVIPPKPVPPINGTSVSPSQTQLQAGSQIESAATVSPSSPPLDERFYVQISSQPSQQAAIQSAEDAGQRFGAIFGNNQIVIVPADIPGRGIYYRVRVLVNEQATANSLCERYKEAGGSCFVGH